MNAHSQSHIMCIDALQQGPKALMYVSIQLPITHTQATFRSVSGDYFRLLKSRQKQATTKEQ